MPWMGYGQSTTEPTCLSPSTPGILSVSLPDDLRTAVAMLSRTGVQPTVSNDEEFPGLYKFQRSVSCWIPYALASMAFVEGVPSAAGTPGRGLALLREAAEVHPNGVAYMTGGLEVTYTVLKAEATLALNEAKKHLLALIKQVAQARQTTQGRVGLTGWQTPTRIETAPDGITKVPLAPWKAAEAALPSGIVSQVEALKTETLWLWEDERLQFMPYQAELSIERDPVRHINLMFALRRYVSTGNETLWEWLSTPNAGYWLGFKDRTDLIAGWLRAVEEKAGRIPGYVPIDPGAQTTMPPAMPPTTVPPVTPVPNGGAGIPPQTPPPNGKLPPGTTPGTPVAATKGISALLLAGAVGATALGIWGYKNRDQFS